VKRNEKIEEWLRTEVVAAYDALRANPESAVALDQVRAELAAEYAKAKQKK
jgi:antitoxin ParD1/3/4